MAKLAGPHLANTELVVDLDVLHVNWNRKSMTQVLGFFDREPMDGEPTDSKDQGTPGKLCRVESSPAVCFPSCLT